MSGMVEVLTRHQFSHSDWDDPELSVTCHCGVETTSQDDGEEGLYQVERLFAQHVARALASAGYGKLASRD